MLTQREIDDARRRSRRAGPSGPGGRVPWGAWAEYACRAGYDGRSEPSFETVAVPGCSAMLVRTEMLAA